MKKVIAVVLGVLLVSFLFSCSLPQASRNEGSLALLLTDATGKGQTLLPAITMDIAKYDIFGAGPGNAAFSHLDVPLSGTVVINALTQGAWQITVDGKNADGARIGTGTSSATVVPGETTMATVTVAPVTGSGTLHLSVSWPPGLISAPSVTGTLTPIGGTASNLGFVLAGNSLSASFDSGPLLAAGYGTLSIILMDGATTAWAGVVAVRIVTGNTTFGTFTLTPADIMSPVGDVNITISPALNSPMQVSLDHQRSIVVLGTSMTVRLRVSESYESYQWFLNGVPVSDWRPSPGVVGPRFAEGDFGGLSVGNYRLDGLVKKGQVFGSTSFAFKVVPGWSIDWQSLGGPASGHFNYPAGIALDGTNHIYVADTGNNRIVRMDDINGAGWATLGTQGGGTNQFNGPLGVAVDPAGHIYIADSGNGRLVCVNDMNGTGWTSLGSPGSGVNQLSNPGGVAVDSSGHIYVADTNNNRIVRVNDINGTGWVSFGMGGSGAMQFSGPSGVAVDAVGHVFVTDTLNRRVVRINDMYGAGWIAIGGTQGYGAFQIFAPGGITVDTSGRIYVTDTFFRDVNRVIRMNDMGGSGWSTFSGNYAGLSGTMGSGMYQFNVPSAVAVDSTMHIYVADRVNYRIVRLMLP